MLLNYQGMVLPYADRSQSEGALRGWQNIWNSPPEQTGMRNLIVTPVFENCLMI
jgi:hypothetical protein